MQTSLYSVFGIVGPFLEVGALLSAGVLVFKLRGRPAFPFTLASLIVIALSLTVWAVLVLPANGHINDWAASGVAPVDWTRWRAQWQYGQAATFVLHLLGLGSLLHSVIRETPAA